MPDQLFREDLMGRIRSLIRTEARRSTPGVSASVLSGSGTNTTDQILFRLRQRVPTAVSDIRAVPDNQEFTGMWVELETCISASAMVGEINPRHPGFLNDRIQSVKRLMRRSLGWYTRPLRLFHGAVIRTLQQCVAALETQQEILSERALQGNRPAAEMRLDDIEQATCQIYQFTQSAIEKSEAQYQVTQSELKALRENLNELRAQVASNRQQLKEAMTGYRLPEQLSAQRDSGGVDFLRADLERAEQDQS